MNKLLWIAGLVIAFTIGWHVGHYQTVLNDSLNPIPVNPYGNGCDAGAPQ